MSDHHLNKIWDEHPEYIRRFYENLETNKNLCQEVEYILATEIAKTDIETENISSRVKTLESFCEKISRKSYKQPFDEITDFAGARIIFLYSADRVRIEQIIEREFEVIERVDKVLADEDKFGYGALHYLVKIKGKHAGARYDDLKNMICEIQVRTILQDAWAVVAHHLSYKQESDVPKELRRKLNALSGLFETADDQFEHIRYARKSYQKGIQHSIQKGNEFSNQEEANIDNFEVYMNARFPDRKCKDIAAISDLLEDLRHYGYSTLGDIDAMVSAALDAVLAEEAKYPPRNKGESKPTRYTPVGLIRTPLFFMSDDYLHDNYSEMVINRNNEFKHLIKKS